MEENKIILINEIKNFISNKFPLIEIIAYENLQYNEIVISVMSRDLYYSESFQELISNININYLWPKGILNVIFILSEESFIQTNINYEISSSEIIFKNDWIFISQGLTNLIDSCSFYDDNSKMAA